MSINDFIYEVERYREANSMDNVVCSSSYNTIPKEIIEYEKNKLLEEIRIKREQQQKLVQELFFRKKELYIPLPSHPRFMQNKDFDYQFLGRIMLDTKYGGRFNMENFDHRFIYKEQIFKLDEEGQVPQVAKDLGISERTLHRRLKMIMQTNLGLVEVGRNEDKKLFYKINYSTDNKYYIILHNDMLKRLVASTNSNMIKIYIVMKYLLTEPIHNEIGQVIDFKYHRKQITYDYLLEKIGLSKDYNRELLKGMIEDLSLLGYIQIHQIQEPLVHINEETNANFVTNMGYEYQVNSYEEWAKYLGKSIKKRERKTKKK